MVHLSQKSYIQGIELKDNLNIDFDIESNGLQKLKETIDQRKKDLNPNSKTQTKTLIKTDVGNGANDNNKEPTHWAHKAKFIVPLVTLVSSIILLIVLQFAFAVLTAPIGIGIGVGGALLAGASFFILDKLEKTHTKGNPPPAK